MRMSRSGCRPRRLLIVILADPDADEPEVRYPSGRMQRQTPMSSASSSELGPLIRKLRSISDLTDQEQRAIADLPVITRILKARREIVRTQDRPVQCCVVLDGWICRYVMLRGMRRQIVSFHIPGDVPDLQGLHLPMVDHAVATLVRSTVAFISHEDLRDLVLRFPNLGVALWRVALVDAAVAREWMTGLGRRSAYQRVAHFLCEQYLRLQAVGLADDNCCGLPPTQRELSDAVGLSANQFNRALQELRGQGLITLEDRVLVIKDWRALTEAGEFKPAYLHLEDHAAA
jgi:CRP-like cAMP-binding protein